MFDATIWIDDPEDEDRQIQIKLPTHKEVCSRCRGNGKHVNPAIDGNGLTYDDIERLGGDEFMEDYLGGVYDVRCEECNGDKVVDVVDEDRLSPEILKEYHGYLQAEWELKAEYEAERRMGC